MQCGVNFNILVCVVKETMIIFKIIRINSAKNTNINFEHKACFENRFEYQHYIYYKFKTNKMHNFNITQKVLTITIQKSNI